MPRGGAAALVTAASWLEQDLVDGCVIVGAEELDWLTADAFRLFTRRIVVSDGAVRGHLAWALLAYGATIVSFLGGIHWGLGFRAEPADPGRFVWGVVPSLVAWVAVMMPPSSGLVIHGVLLLVCYGVDRRLYPRFGLQGWLVPSLQAHDLKVVFAVPGIVLATIDRKSVV